MPTRTHAKYQLTKTLPYFFRRWVMRDRTARLEPLYHFDRTLAPGDEDYVEDVKVDEKVADEKR